MEHLRRPSNTETSPSPVLRHIAPTTQTSYVNANGSPKPSPKPAHAHLAPIGLGFAVGSAHAQGPIPTSANTSVVGSPVGDKTRLPNFPRGLSSFGQPNGYTYQGGDSTTSNGQAGTAHGTMSPGVMGHNGNYFSADTQLRNATGQQDNQYALPPGVTRSRRSSVQLAVSVSLASRSRSGTPVQKIGSPPMSPSRRLNREITPGLGNHLGQVDEVVPSEDNGKSKQKVSWMKGSGDDIEFADFGWDEAFEDDDEEYASVSRRSGRTSRARSANGKPDVDGDRLTGLEVEIQGMDLEDHAPGEGREHDGDDIFSPGFKIGEGLRFHGEIIEEVDPIARSRENGRSIPQSIASSISSLKDHPNGISGKRKAYEVVRKLGSGSYAVVYLVKEVGGGQEFALKCLSKQDLSEDALQVQLFEATIHLSLPKHQNIVTLYQTLQTKRWLFLLLEMCPGEDLFYWLEHSRDSPPGSISQDRHHEAPESHPHGRNIPLSSSGLPSSAVPFSTSAMISGMGTPYGIGNSPVAFSHFSHRSHPELHSHHSHSPSIGQATPTTPGLLAAYSANALLSTRRLKLIAAMFAQMCEAVALCHDIGVSHRDIKPENFICCDSEELAGTHNNNDVRLGKKKVIVKLTDFGLATTDTTSGDVECGSRPYMAYECRNELGPSYEPQPADVWSLGVVLLNMLFHRNPWTDPVPGNKNFDGFITDPVDFLLTRFTGIGREVAAYLAERVFSVHIEQRASARDFGRWAKHLPSMIGGKKAVHALRLTYLNGGNSKDRDPLDFKKSPIEPRGGPSGLSNNTTVYGSVFAPFSAMHTAANGTGNGGTKHSSRDSVEDLGVVIPSAPSVEESQEKDEDVDLESQDVVPTEALGPLEEQMETVAPVQSNINSITSSNMSDATSSTTTKRKKRGTRSKNKAASLAAAALMAGMPAARAPNPLADANNEKEAILLELAEASQTLAREISRATKSPEESVIDLDEFPKLGETVTPGEVKKSKWKALMSSSSGNPELLALAKKVQERDDAYRSAPAALQRVEQSKSGSTTRSLNGTQGSRTPGYSPTHSTSTANPTKSLPGGMTSETWRRPQGSMERRNPIPPSNSMTSLSMTEDDRGRELFSGGRYRRSDVSLGSRGYDYRDMSPVPTLGGTSTTSSMVGSSIYSSKGSSIYSDSSWSTTGSKMSTGSQRYFPKRVNPPGVPKNVKQMDGVSWEINELPRQLQFDDRGNMPEGDIYSRPPLPKKTSNRDKGIRPPLESISEKPPMNQRQTSSSTVSEQHLGVALGESPGTSSFSALTRTESRRSTGSNKQSLQALSSSPVKLKMQITSLGKMLSGLKTGRGKE